MHVDMVKFEENNYGWNIESNVTLTEEESSRCDMKSVEHIGDYEIVLKDNIIYFNFTFSKNELWENETIEERLKLITEDIENITKSCLK